MVKVMITGGHGDIAECVRRQLEALGCYKVACPGHAELDVTDIAAVRAYVAGFVPDVLVNNAGMVSDKPILQFDLELERKILDVDLFGTFNCTSAVLALNPEARIVSVGSSAASKVHAGWSSYSAAKAGVVMATRCWAAEGVDAVCLSPSRTRSKMRLSLFPDEDQSTLIDTDDLATTIVYAVQGRYAPGTHIYVTVKNVKDVIAGKITSDNENI